jgi:hypothetical protein
MVLTITHTEDIMGKILIRIAGQDTLINLDQIKVEVVLQNEQRQDISVFDLAPFIDEQLDWDDLLEAAE